jgi:DNA (cytosine-5)-methyltransferase 1
MDKYDKFDMELQKKISRSDKRYKTLKDLRNICSSDNNKYSNHTKIKKRNELIDFIIKCNTDNTNIVTINKTHSTNIVTINKTHSSNFKVLDLFCGCGGMTKGLEDAGLKIVAGIDIWDKAIDSYKQNFKHISVCADVSKLSPEAFGEQYNIKNTDIDIIVGGPPCQGFSIAGKRDIKDPRNSLFMEYVKYLNHFNPKAFIMENVMGILSMKNNSNVKVIDIIMDNLEEKYNCIICKLYASDFEVPQNRRRVIIIGVRKDLNIIPTEPTPLLNKENRIPVSTIILPRNKIDEKYYLSERAINGIIAKREKAKKNGNGFGAQILKMDKPSYTIPARYWKDGYDALVSYSDTEIRRLTILELKRIQSFTDDFVLTGNNKDQIMQIGNAVASKFAYHLGKHLINILQ